MDLAASKRKNEAIKIAQSYFESKDRCVIVETETTGLTASSVVIWLTVMDLDGKILFDELLKMPPNKRMNPEAQAIHGVSLKMLKSDGKDFNDVFDDFLKPLFDSKKLIMFNAEFHSLMLEQTIKAHKIDAPMYMDCLDLQEVYKMFLGRYGNPALPNRENTGEGDCRAVLAILKKMAETDMIELPVEKAPIIYQNQEWPSCFTVTGFILGLLFFIIFLKACFQR
jgi:DNA polymerase-3 subunit epsilon